MLAGCRFQSGAIQVLESRRNRGWCVDRAGGVWYDRNLKFRGCCPCFPAVFVEFWGKDTSMKKRKICGRLLSLVLAAGMCLPAQAAFTDTEGHWAQAAIDKWSQEYGIIQGYEDGSFQPDQFVSRGAFAGILDRFLRFRTASAPETFSDISGNFWEQEILKLHAAGVYLGNEGMALAGDSITRQQAVTMIARAFQVEASTTSLPYGDADMIAEYARPAVAEFTARGYINDVRDGNFRPTDPITRAEIINILNNMIMVLIQENETYDQDVPGTVMINSTEGAVLKDMVISGDLILAPGVGGEVVLDDVTIGGSIRNFSPIIPTVDDDDREEPEDPQDPEDPEQTEGIDPSTVYEPGTTTGETFQYNGTSIPIYEDRPLNVFAQGDFSWDGDRLVYEGDDFRTRFGIDVSAYQNRASENETIDWEAVRDDGVEFVFVRAGLRGYGSGALLEDAYFHKNVEGALEAGLETGVYFFSQAITVEEAIEEADMVIRMLDGHDIDGPVAYDWEMHDSTYRVYGISPEMATACAVAFCRRIEEAGYTPMVYASTYVNYVKYDQGAIADYLSWYPEYKSDQSEKLYPTLLYHMDYWQFTSSCTIDGIGGRVDANLQFIRR